jgi:hypothetical protein
MTSSQMNVRHDENPTKMPTKAASMANRPMSQYQP